MCREEVSGHREIEGVPSSSKESHKCMKEIKLDEVECKEI